MLIITVRYHFHLSNGQWTKLLDYILEGVIKLALSNIVKWEHKL